MVGRLASRREEEEPDEDVYGDKDGQGVTEDVAEESGHFDICGLGDSLDHEIGSVADVGAGAEEDGAGGNGDEEEAEFSVEEEEADLDFLACRGAIENVVGVVDDHGAEGLSQGGRQVGVVLSQLGVTDGVFENLHGAVDLGLVEAGQFGFEEGHIGWGVVENGGEGAGGEVVLSRGFEGKEVGVGMKPLEGGGHSGEDTEEENGDLANGAVGEFVLVVDDFGGEEEGGEGGESHHDFAAEEEQADEFWGEAMLAYLFGDGEDAGLKDGPDDETDEEEVVDSMDEDGGSGIVGFLSRGASVVDFVDDEEDDEQQADSDDPDELAVLQDPPEWDAAEVTEEEWGIADGGKQSADI